MLKTVGILNLLDVDDLLPTTRSVAACLSMFGPNEVNEAIGRLGRSGRLFERGGTGAFRLWPTSSINLQGAVEAAKRAVGTVEAIGPSLSRLLDGEMVLARRHYLETGTMRYFELRYAAAEDVASCAAKPTEADGLIILSLADQKEQQKFARDAAVAPAVAGDPAILIGLLPPVWHLAAYLLDVVIWQWVESNTPDLANDDFAAAEVQRQITRSRQALRGQFEELTRVGAGERVEWLYRGRV